MELQGRQGRVGGWLSVGVWCMGEKPGRVGGVRQLCGLDTLGVQQACAQRCVLVCIAALDVDLA